MRQYIFKPNLFLNTVSTVCIKHKCKFLFYFIFNESSNLGNLSKRLKQKILTKAIFFLPLLVGQLGLVPAGVRLSCFRQMNVSFHFSVDESRYLCYGELPAHVQRKIRIKKRVKILFIFKFNVNTVRIVIVIEFL